jgi:hypothetical protein
VVEALNVIGGGGEEMASYGSETVERVEETAGRKGAADV